MAELKACPNPWCEAGEREGDFRPQVQYSNFGMVFVACTSCTMAGPTRQHEHEAITAWNTRATRPDADALAEALRPFAAEAFNYDYNDGTPALREYPDGSSLDEMNDLLIKHVRIARAADAIVAHVRGT